jgi:hypothetical protein
MRSIVSILMMAGEQVVTAGMKRNLRPAAPLAKRPGNSGN